MSAEDSSRSLPAAFGARVQAELDKREWSHETLAGLSGISRPQITNYIRGNNVPGLDKVQKVAQALGTDPWKLLQPEEPAKPGLAPAPISGLDDLVQCLHEIAQGDAAKLIEMFWDLLEFKFPEQARKFRKPRQKNPREGNN